MTVPHLPNARARILAVAALGMVLMASQGCYEKVVGASGFGAEAVQIEKPNGPDTRSSKTFDYKKSTQKELPSPGSK
jgi:hypothetical protein